MGVATPTAAPARHDEPGAGVYRADLDGVRAIAVLLVVAYHAGVPGFSAGFIGVDVFFVLSGFLITRGLIAELDVTGGVDLPRFWVRRARRLIPASMIVIGSTVLAALAVTPALDLATMLTDAAAGLVYVSNLVFANRATDYFADDLSSSPFLHLWSLAVEEQFYLVWPLLLSVLWRVGGGRGRRVATLGVAAISVASFLLAQYLVAAEAPSAFFSLGSRAWEFGAGALVAIVGVRSVSPRLARAISFGGLTMLVAGLVSVDPSSFPGTGALVPVLAATALVAGNADGSFAGRVLTATPARTLGHLSYSWYLWHWPALVLGRQILGEGLIVSCALVVAALGPAWLSYRFVEDRIRHAPSLVGSARRTVAVVGLFMCGAVASIGIGLAFRAVMFADPVVAAAAEARAQRTELVDGCTKLDPAEILARCSGGSPDGDLVLLVGDSHAAHWLPAVTEATRDTGQRWAMSVLGNCPTTSYPAVGRVGDCVRRQQSLPATIAELAPTTVVMSHSVGYVGGAGGIDPDASDAWAADLTAFASALAEQGIDLVLVLDVPRFRVDPLECAVDTRSFSGCSRSIDQFEGITAFHDVERSALADVVGAVTIDGFSILCGPEVCPIERDGIVLYADEHHVTQDGARLLVPQLRDALGG